MKKFYVDSISKSISNNQQDVNLSEWCLGYMYEKNTIGRDSCLGI